MANRKTLRLNNRLRGLIDTALASHQLLAADSKNPLGRRAAVAEKAQNPHS